MGRGKRRRRASRSHRRERQVQGRISEARTRVRRPHLRPAEPSRTCRADRCRTPPCGRMRLRFPGASPSAGQVQHASRTRVHPRRRHPAGRNPSRPHPRHRSGERRPRRFEVCRANRRPGWRPTGLTTAVRERNSDARLRRRSRDPPSRFRDRLGGEFQRVSASLCPPFFWPVCQPCPPEPTPNS